MKTISEKLDEIMQEKTELSTLITDLGGTIPTFPEYASTIKSSIDAMLDDILK